MTCSRTISASAMCPHEAAKSAHVRDLKAAHHLLSQLDVYSSPPPSAEASASSRASPRGRARNAASRRASSAAAAASRLVQAANTGSLTPKSRAVLAVSRPAHAQSASVSNCRFDGRQTSLLTRDGSAFLAPQSDRTANRRDVRDSLAYLS